MKLDTHSHLDPMRLQCAVHELGHLTVWERLTGARIVEVSVTGHGNGVAGQVHVDWPKHDTPELIKGYLIGLLAGREADLIWCDMTGARHTPRTCQHDLACFRNAQRKHAPSRQWSERELRTDARTACRAAWPTLLRRATTLAHRGRI